MTLLGLTSADRVLVLAPHPDDETLACGTLIQRALSVGASVSVVVATNGDNNPWPQRLVERRWRLDQGDAARWGDQRASEARDALKILGVCADDVHFLNWRDQGVTALIEHEPAIGIHPLRVMLDSLRPTLVVGPSLSDSHPDHSALALILHAALRGGAHPARVLAYWLHGTRQGKEGSVRVESTRAELQCKRQAILAHRTQLHFGRGRLLAYAQPREVFHEESIPPAISYDWRWAFYVGNRLAGALLNRLRVVSITADGIMRATTIGLHEAGVTLRRAGRLVDVAMPPLWSEAASIIAKLDHSHGLYVYDACAWQTGSPAIQHRAEGLAAVEGPTEFANPGQVLEGLPSCTSHFVSLPEPDMRPSSCRSPSYGR